MEIDSKPDSKSNNEWDKEKQFGILRKLGLNKEYINLEDIILSLEKIRSIDIGIIKETAEKIINELDKEKLGEIKSVEMIDYIILMSQKEMDQGVKKEFAIFMEKINEEMFSKSQKIVEKLKKIKNKAWLAGDSESCEDIDWIMSVLNEEDLYEPEFTPTKGNGLDYIAKYSHIEANQRKEQDLLTLNNNRKTSTLSIKSVNLSSTETDNANNQRRNTRMSTFLSPSLLGKIFSHLENVAKLDFNIFDLDELVERKTTFYLSYEIFSRKDYFQSLIDEDKFKNFTNEIIKGYNRHIAYHNDLHAGDVLQTMYHVIVVGDLERKLHLSELDTFAILLAALSHDFKHTGHNNTFHINSKSEVAIAYNDTSVLENYSISELYKVLMVPDSNIMSNLSPEEYRICRKRIIESILATDMAFHQKNLSTLKTKMETFDIKKGRNINKMMSPDNLNRNFENQQMLLNFTLHVVDISSPGKQFTTCHNWMQRVYEEFFLQGDLEKQNGLPVSLLCDRNTVNTIKSQIGFMTFVVAPTFETLADFFPETSQFVDNITQNVKRYQNMMLEEENLINSNK